MIYNWCLLELHSLQHGTHVTSCNQYHYYAQTPNAIKFQVTETQTHPPPTVCNCHPPFLTDITRLPSWLIQHVSAGGNDNVISSRFFVYRSYWLTVFLVLSVCPEPVHWHVFSQPPFFSVWLIESLAIGLNDPIFICQSPSQVYLKSHPTDFFLYMNHQWSRLCSLLIFNMHHPMLLCCAKYCILLFSVDVLWLLSSGKGGPGAGPVLRSQPVCGLPVWSSVSFLLCQENTRQPDFSHRANWT